MKAKILIGAGAGALALAGVGVGVSSVADRAAPASFVNPLDFARSICGDAHEAQAQRRLYFARIGAAVAKETTPVAADGAAPPPIGAIAHKVATASPLAQAHFNRGLAFLYNFNHGAAIEAFKAAQAADPDCAMCYWAESFAFGPNINAPMADEAVAPAFAALKKAQSHAAHASEKERALIAALAKRYAPAPVKDRAKLDAAFADAMDKVASAYPDDDFIAVLAAEANMDTQPWDYWEKDGRTAKGRAARTVSLIESVLARNPDHPAAIHLYIHITEATNDPYRAAPHADRLAALSPGLGHLIHMPSHTYYRIGRFKQSIDVNLEAVAADEAFLAANKAEPMYEFGYYVHNVHFVMMSALMAGDADNALAMAEKLDKKLPLAMAADVPFAQPIKVAPYYAWARFAAPDAVMALADPGDELPFVKAAWHYARGEALARRGDAAAARAEAAAISRISAEEDLSPLEEINIPATGILNVQRATLLARAAAAERDFAGAVEAMEAAVAAQDDLAYTEPPYWYYPARQTLAAMVLENGNPERAQQLFVEALAQAPNNGWALYGMAESFRRQGDKTGAKFAHALFKSAWTGDAKKLTLSEL